MSQLHKSAQIKILFCITGSIAAFKSLQVLSDLKKLGYQIKVVMTASAKAFIGEASVEGLTGEAPYVETFESHRQMAHINLIRCADLIVCAPASANTINSFAHGLGQDLLSTLFLAHDFKKPFLVFPAMNSKMLEHPATQLSIKKLIDWGLEFHYGQSGELACGEYGSGRLVEPHDMIKIIISKINSLKNLQSNVENQKNINLSHIKILITGGGTQEPIDDVRVITNKSTGRTSADLADFFHSYGADVTLICHQNSVKPHSNCKMINYTDFNSLQNILIDELKKQNYDYCLHAAAVSDYSVAKHIGKINSDQEILEIKLKRNPKLIQHFKDLQPNTQLVSFKLTSNATNEYIESKLSSLLIDYKSDLVIHNDWQQIQNNHHVFNLFNFKENKINKIETELTAHDLKKYLLNYISNTRSQK